MVDRTTYMLGAGASHDALPTMQDIEGEVNTVIAWLTTDCNKAATEGNEVAAESIEQAVGDLRILAEACKNHMSVDTYARMLFNNNRLDECKKIKNVLILFFELYQYYFPKIDKRYDSFLASYVQPTPPRFPSNVNIISWNYDYELEKALMNYCKPTVAFNEVYKEIAAHHKGLHKQEYDFSNFNLVKINGTIGYRYNNEVYLGVGNQVFQTEQDKQLNLQHVCPTLAKYRNLANKYEPLVSFAWEQESPLSETVKKAAEIMQSTIHLVVVGYSFPQVNNDIDGMLFNEGTLPNIRKIFVQDNEPHTIIERIKAFRADWYGINFVPIEDSRTFYVPYQPRYNY